MAKELIVLYHRFNELDIDKKSKLSNQEFLSMRELLYNPFRHRIKYALQMKSDEYVKNTLGVLENKDESFEKATLVPASNGTSNKIAPQPEEVPDVDKVNYIDFSLFCQYLAVFCTRAPKDLKFTCNLYLVLFRLLDMDEDGSLSKEDLIQSTKIIVAGNLGINDINLAVDRIFEESDVDQKNYINREEFQKALWMTDFHQKVSLFFI